MWITLRRAECLCLPSPSCSTKYMHPLYSEQHLIFQLFFSSFNYSNHCILLQSFLLYHGADPRQYNNAICGPDDVIRIPGIVKEPDYEVELVVVIGKKGKRIPGACLLRDCTTCRSRPPRLMTSSEYVGVITRRIRGPELCRRLHQCVIHSLPHECWVVRVWARTPCLSLAVGHDVSARDWQLKKAGGQWMVGKTFDYFAPIGPAIVTSDEGTCAFHPFFLFIVTALCIDCVVLAFSILTPC